MVDEHEAGMPNMRRSHDIDAMTASNRLATAGIPSIRSAPARDPSGVVRRVIARGRPGCRAAPPGARPAARSPHPPGPAR